jgi:hypothetical protein
MTDQELLDIEAHRVLSPAEHDSSDYKALIAEVRRLRGLIREAEWAATCQGDSECPWCQAWAFQGEHRADCPAFANI